MTEPVVNPSSVARYTTARETASGGNHGTPSGFSSAKTRSTSSLVGRSTSGRNIRYHSIVVDHRCARCRRTNHVGGDTSGGKLQGYRLDHADHTEFRSDVVRQIPIA